MDATTCDREQLTALTYELLDALYETAAIASVPSDDRCWTVQLDYLRDLQRVGRELLARA